MAQTEHIPSSDLKVSFSYTADELRELYGKYYAQAYRTSEHRLSRRQQVCWWLFLAGSGAALLVLLFLNTRGILGAPTWLMLMLVATLVLGLLNLADDRPQRSKLAYRAVESFLKSYLAEEASLETTVELVEQGICIDNASERLLVRWRGVGHLSQTPQFINIQRLDSGGVAVPLRAFKGIEHSERFLAEARRRQLAAGSGHDQRVFAYLAEHDANCPGCGYNLRGTKVLKCPECGRSIAWSDVPAAFEAR